jgi:hypothetical protein
MGTLANVRATGALAGRRAATRSRPRLGYIGWPNAGNLGDDAMLEAARRLFADCAPLLYGHPRQERRLRSWRLSGAPYFDGVVLGGGTLVNAHFLPFVREALDSGVPVWSLGTGVGSIGFSMPNAPAPLVGWPELLERCERVTVRGPLSKAALADCGFDGAEVVGDLALALADPLDAPAGPPTVAVNFVTSAGSGIDDGIDWKRTATELDAALRVLIAAGWRCRPIVFDERDRPHLDALAARLDLPPGSVVAPRDAVHATAVLRECRFSVGVRLHSAILAANVGVPSVMLAYRGKGHDFMRSVDMERWSIELLAAQPGAVERATLAMAEEADALRPALAVGVTRLQARLEATAAGIRERLGPG